MAIIEEEVMSCEEAVVVLGPAMRIVRAFSQVEGALKAAVEANARVMSAKEELAKVEKQREDKRAELQSIVEDAAARKVALQAEAEREMEAYRADEIEAAEGRLRNLAAREKEMRGQIEGLRKSIASLEGEQEALNAEMLKARQEKHALTDGVEALRRKYDDFVGRERA